MKYYITEDKGARDSMEDANCVCELEHGLLVGLFDGHNGPEAAKYAAEKFPGKMKEALNFFKPKDAFRRVFEELSREIEKVTESGTTALASLLNSESLAWANAGDSRLLIINNNKIVQITKDHRIENPEERKRITGTGIGKIRGLCVTVDGINFLEPTRSLGDRDFKKAGVIATPETGKYKIEKGDLFFVAVCDGISDKVTNEGIGRIVRKSRDVKEAALRIKDVAVKRDSKDNLTIIVGKIR